MRQCFGTCAVMLFCAGSIVLGAADPAGVVSGEPSGSRERPGAVSSEVTPRGRASLSESEELTVSERARRLWFELRALRGIGGLVPPYFKGPDGGEDPPPPPSVPVKPRR